MISESTSSTIQHVERLTRKIDQLDETRRDAVAQLVHRIAQEYRSGLVELVDLLAAYDRLKATAGPGWGTAWLAVELPRRAAIVSLIAALPNGPGGSWWGTGAYPSADHPMPPPAQSVVYVLYDAANEPCYVGSSEQFRTRLRTHIREGKTVTYWTAFPCADRDSAYRLEDRLLKQHKPYLNIQGYAWTGSSTDDAKSRERVTY